MHTMSWKIVCKPKSNGSLGIRRLKETNRVFLTKLTCRYHTERDALWTDVLKEKYGELTEF